MSEEQVEYVVNGRSTRVPFLCEVCGGEHPTLQQARDCKRECKEYCRKRRIERELGGRICTCDACMANATLHGSSEGRNTMIRIKKSPTADSRTCDFKNVSRVPKYRKKPVVIEALQWDGQNQWEIEKWAHEGMPPEMNSIILLDLGECLKIRTLEGYMTAQKGDWIIKGVKGEFYPCKPDIFEATYEPVDSANATLLGSSEAKRKEVS